MTLPGRKATFLLVVVITLGALVAVWDWNWFRAPLERHLVERSGREVSIADLHVGFSAALEPTVRLRGVRIANATWARSTGSKPFVVAGELAFTFSARSLTERRPIISLLLMRDADVNLERAADGLRNWRLRSPEDRDPGRFKFLRLEAHHSQLRFVHHGVALDLQTAAQDLPSPVDTPAGGPLTTTIAFSGQYRGADFQGNATTARVLTFLETDEAFAVRGAGTSGKTRLEADGLAADLFRLGAVDAELRLSGDSLADLKALWPRPWPATAPYTLKGRLAKDDGLWHVPALRAEIGRSDVSGDLRYNAQSDPPFLEATLSAEAVRLTDFLPKTGAKAASPAAAASGAEGGPLDGLRRVDARVELKVRSLQVPAAPPLTQLRATARLEDGLLDISPLSAQAAGGQIQGLLSLDARKAPATARAELAWRNLRLEQLLPTLPDGGEATGPLSGELKLTSRAGDWPELVKNAAGRASAQLRGGRLSAALEAKLALNGGQLLRAKVAEASDVPILCARADIVLKQGRADITQLLLDTAKTRIDGRGDVDLDTMKYALMFTPSLKETALLALRQSVTVSGALGDKPEIALVSREPLDTRTGCDNAPAAKSSR